MPQAQKTCQYCGSPIPIGSDTCKSCQLSGEIVKSEERSRIREKRKSTNKLLFGLIIAAIIVVVGIGIAIFVRLHK